MSRSILRKQHLFARRRIYPAILGMAAILLLLATRAQAQIADDRWSEMVRLSSEEGQASEAVMLPDDHGFLHVFWAEHGLPDNESIIQYVRFDGERWTEPLDIYVSPPFYRIGNVSADIDSAGRLHVVWSVGVAGPVYYTFAPAHASLSAWEWTEPRVIGVPASWVALRVDSQDMLHLAYTQARGEEEEIGVYYIRSADGGQSWTLSNRLDPDIPEGMTPNVLQFELDDQDGLHMLWYYRDPESPGFPGRWIRYTRSLDGGKSWSELFTVEQDLTSSGDSYKIQLPYPSLITQGDNILIIWGGDQPPQQYFRFSRDRGSTWSKPQRFFGDLVGQAHGGGLARDANDRVHFVAQLRYPMGLWHAYWDQTQWTDPQMFYLIQEDHRDEPGDRVSAHGVRLAVRAGNQLVTTFTTSPSDPQLILYAMHRTLEDVEPVPALATPTALPTVTPTVTPVVTPPPEITTPTPVEVPAAARDQMPPVEGNVSSPFTVLGISVLPASLIVLGVLISGIIWRRFLWLS